MTREDPWLDLETAIALSVDADLAPKLIQKLRDLRTAERMRVDVAEQVKAINWVASELGADTTIGKAVTALGLLVETGVEKL